MFHIVESCSLTKLNGSLFWLHSADEDAVSWLTSYGSRHTYEKKKKLFNAHLQNVEFHLCRPSLIHSGCGSVWMELPV